MPDPTEPTPDAAPTPGDASDAPQAPPDATDAPPVWSRARRVTVVIAGIVFFLAGISGGIVVSQAEDERAEEAYRIHHAHHMMSAEHAAMQSPAFVAALRTALAREDVRVDDATLRSALADACRQAMDTAMRSTMTDAHHRMGSHHGAGHMAAMDHCEAWAGDAAPPARR